MEKKVKRKSIDRIRKRMKKDMQEKTKCGTLRNGKQYIKNCENNTIKDVIKIRLYMRNTKCNYKRNRHNMSPLQNRRRRRRAHNGMPRSK